MKTYESRRSFGQCIVTVNGQRLDPRFDLRMHSPNGFEWGYGGSGPAQLALAILADHFGDEAEALNFYQRFKWTVIEALPRRGWTLTTTEICQALDAIRQQESDPQPVSG